VFQQHAELPQLLNLPGLAATINRINGVLRHERVLAIIGNMGSGKSALSDIVALAGSAMDVVANLELFRENALNKSINSWGHVFYAGVLADPGLMDYLRQGQLPAHL
jgi:ABC-type phosphate transport system ATPase subunit